MGKRKNNRIGSVYYNKSKNSWYVDYYIYDREKDKNVKKMKTVSSEREGKEFLSALQYQKGNELFIENNGIPLNQLMRMNLRKKLDMNLITETQYSRVEKTILALEKQDFVKKNIDKITSDEIQDFINTFVDHSNSYIRKIMEQFRQAFNYAHNKGYITRNPMIDIIKPKSLKQDRVVRALTVEEQEKFTNYLMSKTIKEEPNKNVYLLQMYCGLRVGEALAMQTTDIDLAHNLIRINKTLTKDKNDSVIMGNKTKTYAGMREIPIPPLIRDSLIDQVKLAKEEYHFDNQLFVSSVCNYVNPANVNRLLKDRMEKLGIDRGITTHSLRHTFGTRCVEAGMRAVALQRLMGHTDISTTLNTYTSVFNKYKETELEKVNDYYLSNNFFTTSEPKGLDVPSKEDLDDEIESNENERG